MNPDWIERFERGERYTAEQVNLRGDLLKQLHIPGRGAQDGTGSFHREREEREYLVLMQNKTGADRKRYEVGGVSAILRDPVSYPTRFQYEVGLKGITPAVPTHNNKWGVWQESVVNNEIAKVKVSGVTQVKVDIQDTSDPFCDVKDGTCTELISNSSGGATILNPVTTTGVQWCVVRIEGNSAPEVWYFELADTLVQWTSPIVPVDSYRRVWDPSLNAGWGGFATDCTQTLKVGDYAVVGFFGVSGANGWAELRQADNGVVGIIRGLNCPDSCVCGTDYTETTPCGGT